jgi:hypothetical protein
VVVIAEVPYIAKINIYDHLGKFIHSSTQRFGFCGELDNQDRAQAGGYLGWLVWNQKDEHKKLVGSGVYLWKVKFHYTTTGETRNIIYKQGIARITESTQKECFE